MSLLVFLSDSFEICLIYFRTEESFLIFYASESQDVFTSYQNHTNCTVVCDFHCISVETLFIKDEDMGAL